MLGYSFKVFAIHLHPLTQVFLILAVVSLLISILLFIVWHIPRTFGELTGYTERKQVSKFSQQNRHTSEFSKELKKREGQYTTKISTSEISIYESPDDSVGAPTELLREESVEKGTQVLAPEDLSPSFSVIYSLQFSESKKIIS